MFTSALASAPRISSEACGGSAGSSGTLITGTTDWRRKAAAAMSIVH
jgi:hypothetical protein